MVTLDWLILVVLVGVLIAARRCLDLHAKAPQSAVAGALRQGI